MPAKKGLPQPCGTFSFEVSPCKCCMAIHATSNAANRHDNIFDQIAQNNAMHATENRIKHSKQRKNNSIKMRYIFRRNMKRNIWLHYIPGNKNFDEFTKANKTISHKTKATN